MSGEQASFSFSFQDGTLELSGSELFVSQQVEFFRSAILDYVKAGGQVQQPLLAVPQSEVPIEASDNVSSAVAEELENPYPNELAEHDGKVSILIKLSSGSKAEKTVKLCMIYLWAKEKLLGEQSATSSELRDLCQHHAVYDPANFATTLKGKNKYFLISGAKGSNTKSYKLTIPGKEEAEKTLKEISS